MASFSVTNNAYLRAVYSPERALSTASARAGKSAKTLIAADSSALSKAVKAMNSLDFDKDDATGKDKFFKTLKSFTDAYNYTVSSSGSTKNKKMSSMSKGLKEFTAKYESELKSLGISIKNGYMSISSNASNTVSLSSYKEMFGKDSSFMKELSSYAKKLNRNVDIAL